MLLSFKVHHGRKNVIEKRFAFNFYAFVFLVLSLQFKIHFQRWVFISQTFIFYTNIYRISFSDRALRNFLHFTRYKNIFTLVYFILLFLLCLKKKKLEKLAGKPFYAFLSKAECFIITFYLSSCFGLGKGLEMTSQRLTFWNTFS